MSCYHPLKGFIVGKHKSGKDKLLVTGYDVDHLEQPIDGHSWNRVYSEDQQDPFGLLLYPRYEIPCGHCIGCRLDQSRDWANRCLLEMKEHESNLFITLTYDDEHLPYSTGVLPDTGEFVTTQTLVKRDWQLFMKRLRKWFSVYKPDSKLRFFMAGEYGDLSYRPHYHAIIFGLDLPDLVWYKRDGDFDYYVSDTLSGCWNQGLVVVAPATWETAAYTARYCTKKLTGPMSSIYEILGIEPEFCLMSRRPGIGADYADEHMDHLLDFEKICVSTPQGGRSFPVPKYFKRKYDCFFESDLIKLQEKDDRQRLNFRLMESMKVAQLAQTDLSYLDLLAVAEHAKLDQVKGLERSL